MNYFYNIYGKSRNGSPSNIIKLDNNLDIIKYCQEAKLINDVFENVNWTKSQVKLLIDWSMLRVADDKLISCIPLINEKEAKKIQVLAKREAGDIVEKLSQLIDEWVSTDSSLENNLFSLFFSYVLDGMVWKYLSKTIDVGFKEYDDTNVSFAGYMHGIATTKKDFFGTNTYEIDDLVMNINWNDLNAEYTQLFYTVCKDIRINLLERKLFGTDEVQNILIERGIIDHSNNILIPIIDENSKDEIVRISHELASRIADHVTDNKNYITLGKAKGLSIEFSLVIYYHELMWEIISTMERTCRIKRPYLLNDSNAATISNNIIKNSELTFLTKLNDNFS